MSTAVPEKLTPEVGSPAGPHVAEKPRSTATEVWPSELKRRTATEDDRRPAEVEIKGNHLRTNNGLAIANHGVMHVGTSGAEVPEVDGPVADRKLRDSREVFYPPPRLEKAWEILDRSHLVLLCGRRTGRSLAAINLLVELGITDLQHLNPERSVDTITPSVFGSGAGYIWNASRYHWERRLIEGRVTRLSRMLGDVGAKLVVIVDDIAALPKDAHAQAITLSAPDPVQVLRKHLRRGNVDLDELPNHIAPEVIALLGPGAAPAEVVEIAELVFSMRQRGFRAGRGLAELRRKGEDDVLAWFRDERQSLAARALMIAVAVYEGRSSAEVFSAALRLEKLLDNPEHRLDWPPGPPDLFADTRAARRAAVKAELVAAAGRARSEDPERIRFEQPGWAASVLTCVWTQYDRLRPTLKEWLGALPTHGNADVAGARVFGQLLSRTPGPDPTAELTDWGGSELLRQREMAVAALNSMAEHPRLVPVVRARLALWSRSVAAPPFRSTAALAYGGAFGQRHPNLALKQLKAMTHRADDDLQNAVTVGIHELAMEPANRAEVLASLVTWTERTQRVSLRNVALASSLFVLGLMRAKGKSPTPHRHNIAKDQKSARFIGPIVANLMANGQTARQVVLGLHDWANLAEVQPVLAGGLTVVLREVLTHDDPAMVARVSFDLRRFSYVQQEAASALRAAVTKTLESINDQGK